MSNLVPDGWLFSRLGEHVKFSQGVQVGVDEQLKIKAESYIRFIRIVDYTQKTTDIRYVHESNATKGVVEEDEVVMVRYGATGFIGKGISGVIANNMFFVTPNDLISKGFLYQYLSSDRIKDFIQSLVASSTMPALNFSGVSTIPLYLPPLPEQQIIAKILTSVDEVIEITQAQIDKLKDLKTGMMQELLTNGIGHTEFKDSPVGRIPAKWEVKTLDQVVNPDKIITYGIVQAGPHHEGGVPYIRVSDMNSRRLTKKGMLLTSPEIATKFKRSEVAAGDIVYALRGMIGHVQIVPPELGGSNLTQGTARISPSDSINSIYLLGALRSSYVSAQNDLEAKGSTFKEITLASLRKLKICLPEINEQNKISKILGGIESKLFAAEDKLTQITSLKKALMQDLLTGKVRVNVEG